MEQAVIIGFQEGAKYSVFVLAACIIFRIAHFPDIGIEGTYLLGGAAVCLAHVLHFHSIIAVIMAALFGGLGGLLTGYLFVKFKLNSLMCGIITASICYSLSFIVMGFKATVTVLPFFNENYFLGVSSSLIILLTVFFSSRFGLLLRFSGEAPQFVRKIGFDADKNLLKLIVLGNALSGLSGALVSATNANVNIQVGQGLLILALSSLVLGEGCFVIILIAILKVVQKNYPYNYKASKIFISIAGLGSLKLMVAAIVGSIVYWLFYQLVVNYFGATDMTKLVIGLLGAFFLIVSNKLYSKYNLFEPWRFI